MTQTAESTTTLETTPTEEFETPLHVDTSHPAPFVERHIGLRPDDVEHMLGQLGFASLDDFRAHSVDGAA